MAWSVAGFIACVTVQYALARGMKEPDRRIYLALTRSNVLIMGPMLAVIALLYYVTPPSP